MSHIEITQPDPETGGTRVLIDGTNFANSISSLRVDADGPTGARVTVEFVLVEDFRLCSADAELVIGEATADLLEKHGWARPGVAR